MKSVVRTKSVCAALFLLLVSGTAWAEQDFYGIQFADEDWARALVFNAAYPEAPPAEGPVLSHALHAEASLKEVEDRHIAFHLTVFNDSSLQIPTDVRYRDFFVYTRDGKKYPLIDTEEDLPPFIDPNSKVSFEPSFGNLQVRNNEVEMIVCSFDVGRTKLVLFPWSKKETVSKLVSPKLPAVPMKSGKGALRESAKKGPAPEQGPKKKTPKRNFWDWDSKKTKTPDLKRAPVMPTAVEKGRAAAAPAPSAPSSASPDTRQKLDQAIQNFVYTPSTGGAAPPKTASYSAPATAGAAPVRSEAHVLDVNKSYNFVTLNLGEQDGLRENMTVSIVREGKLVAKARVKQVRASVSAATVIPESVRSDVRTGDAVAFV